MLLWHLSQGTSGKGKDTEVGRGQVRKGFLGQEEEFRVCGNCNRKLGMLLLYREIRSNLLFKKSLCLVIMVRQMKHLLLILDH